MKKKKKDETQCFYDEFKKNARKFKVRKSK